MRPTPVADDEAECAQREAQDKAVAHFEGGSVVVIGTGDMIKRSRAVPDLEWKHAGYATLVLVAERNP